MAKKTKDTLGQFLSNPEMEQKPNGGPPACMEAKFPLTDITKAIKDLDTKHRSSARFMYFDRDGKVGSATKDVCFNPLPDFASAASREGGGIGIFFQGYGGFDTGDRWRAATEDDLLSNKAIPFVMEDKGHYGKESLTWLEMLLDPDGPFKTLLPLMLENEPEKVQARQCFIFPDVSVIPARLTWCFAIASRLGFANARVIWRYMHMLDKGLDKRTASLIAGGFEHEIRNNEPTGKIIKSYTCGYLGADVTAYAGRYLSANPEIDKPGNFVGTNGSSKVFLSGKIDMKNLRFDTWDHVIEYVQDRGREQSAELKRAA
jgi:hypothetical protein